MKSKDESETMTPLPCGLIDDYLVGDLTEDTAASFERHLATCADCRETIDQQRWMDGLLRSTEAEALETAPTAVANELSGRVVRLRRRVVARRSLAVAAAASLAAVALWRFVGVSQHEELVEAPDLARRSNEQARVDHAAPPRQSRGLQSAGKAPAESQNAATFVSVGDAIVVPVASDDAQVSIVKVYPTTTAERRWRRELSLYAGLSGQDGG